MGANAIHGSHESRQAVLKAVVVGAQEPASRPGGENEQAWSDAGALLPPYDPEALCLLFEHSNALRQNVDAYSTNIDGFGYRLEPALDLDADDAEQKVADALLLERLAAREAGELPADLPLRATDEEVSTRLESLRQLARLERARLDSFFDGCCFDSSFVDLRRRTRQDLEVTGNAYWEVLRDGRERIARLVHVPAYSIRLLPLDPEPVEIEDRVRVSPISFDSVATRRRLRRYVQVEGTDRVYFRQLGDPRVVSRNTGRVFRDLDALLAVDADDGPATELLHFAISSPRSPYGIPRWIGTLLSVLGSRAAEEVNHSYFANKSVPPLAILVSGGHLAADSIPRLERFVEENLKGRDNFHRILILEAEGATGNGTGPQARIELKPLTQAQQSDALFQTYDERNIDKIGSSFRLPRLLRGESRDFNRSTAEMALRFAEEQVFQPERDQFDFLMNRLILGDMGIRFWKFKSQSPVTRDPEIMSEMVERLVRSGVLVPEEARELAGDIFNRDFRRLPDDWVTRPLSLTLAGIQSGRADVDGDPEPGEPAPPDAAEEAATQMPDSDIPAARDADFDGVGADAE